MFPDHYFFAETCLVNHTRNASGIRMTELLSYLNGNCVSLNFKRDPDNSLENDSLGYSCELTLSNANHLKYDGNLKTDTIFSYRGSKVVTN